MRGGPPETTGGKPNKVRMALVGANMGAHMPEAVRAKAGGEGGGGGRAHEDDGRVGHELHSDGEALALLHRQAALAGLAHDVAPHRLQLHQLQHLPPPRPRLSPPSIRQIIGSEESAVAVQSSSCMRIDIVRMR